MATYCVCNDQVSGGVMVGCDGCHGWFHVRCVGLTVKEAKARPAYFCAVCSARPPRRKRRRAHRRRGRKRRPGPVIDDVDDMDEEGGLFALHSSESDETDSESTVDVETADDAGPGGDAPHAAAILAATAPGVEGVDDALIHRLPEDCLLEIFRYLDCPAELLVAARVCRRWRSVAHSPSLWRRAVIDLSTPFSLNAVRDLLRLHGECSHIELSGGQEVSVRQWSQMLAVLADTPSVTSLNLVGVPARVVNDFPVPHFAARLRELGLYVAFASEPSGGAAVARGRAVMEIAHLGGLSQLQSLCVHTTEPFELPPFSLAGSLSELGDLAQLRVLELNDMDERACVGAHFLSRLQGLASLSIGSCALWSTSEFDDLARLRSLQSLSLRRLERDLLDDDEAAERLASALVGLPALASLELHECVVPLKVGASLVRCASLRRLVLSGAADDALDTDFFVRLDRSLIEVLSQCTQLRELVWRVSPARFNALAELGGSILMEALPATSIDILEVVE